METKLEESAAMFVNTLSDSPEVEAFKRAQARFEGDDELTRFRSQYTEMVQQFQEKQIDGTLTQADIGRLRDLQKHINGHPTTVQFIDARNHVLEVLEQCNRAMSQLLGFDFAATAAPAAAC